MVTFEDLKKKEQERLDLEYDLFLKSWLSFEEYSEKQDKKKLAIQLQNKARLKKLRTQKIIKKENIKTPFFKLNLWSQKLYTFNECIDIWFERCKNI
jgi:hypothetical protein